MMDTWKEVTGKRTREERLMGSDSDRRYFRDIQRVGVLKGRARGRQGRPWRETGLRLGQRRCAGAHFKENSRQTQRGGPTVKCYECGQEVHYRINCPKGAGN